VKEQIDVVSKSLGRHFGHKTDEVRTVFANNLIATVNKMWTTYIAGM